MRLTLNRLFHVQAVRDSCELPVLRRRHDSTYSHCHHLPRFPLCTPMRLRPCDAMPACMAPPPLKQRNSFQLSENRCFTAEWRE
jgi:hypothetical protein